MSDIPVEVCIDCSSDEAVRRSVANAHAAGATRVELCADMLLGGLTPDMRHVGIAREAFRERKAVMVMVRPRAGDFEYNADELDLMADQVSDAEAAGADGVVLGVLSGNRVASDETRRLVDLAHGLDLMVTFHRAFDATRDTTRALTTLIELEVDRVLTSGTPWESGWSAVDGLETLASLALRASGRIEIVVGGGVTRQNATTIVRRLKQTAGHISIHAYSDVLLDGVVDTARVAQLVETCKAAQQ